MAKVCFRALLSFSQKEGACLRGVRLGGLPLAGCSPVGWRLRESALKVWARQVKEENTLLESKMKKLKVASKQAACWRTRRWGLSVVLRQGGYERGTRGSGLAGAANGVILTRRWHAAGVAGGQGERS